MTTDSLERLLINMNKIFPVSPEDGTHSLTLRDGKLSINIVHKCADGQVRTFPFTSSVKERINLKLLWIFKESIEERDLAMFGVK